MPPRAAPSFFRFTKSVAILRTHPPTSAARLPKGVPRRTLAPDASRHVLECFQTRDPRTSRSSTPNPQRLCCRCPLDTESCQGAEGDQCTAGVAETGASLKKEAGPWMARGCAAATHTNLAEPKRPQQHNYCCYNYSHTARAGQAKLQRRHTLAQHRLDTYQTQTRHMHASGAASAPGHIRWKRVCHCLGRSVEMSSNGEQILRRLRRQKT